MGDQGGAGGQACPVRETADHEFRGSDEGGGGILDVGGYPVSFARLLAGAAAGRPFLDPIEVKGTAALHPQTGVDVSAAATLRFADGTIAQVASGVGVPQENEARVYGTRGWIFVAEPWKPAPEGGGTTLVLHGDRGTVSETIAVRADRGLYTYEADAFASAVRAGRSEVPAMTVADTLANMAALDAWRVSAGVVYDAERRS